MLRSFLTPRKIARHLFVLAIVAGCVIAGFWQLSRLHWQNGFETRVSARLHAKPGPLGQLIPPGSAPDPDAITYRHVTVAGTYGASQRLVLVAGNVGDQDG